MVKSDTKAPRASISVTILRDPDVIALRQHGQRGRAAWGDFIYLIVLAKNLDNAGMFRIGRSAVASLMQVDSRSLASLVQFISKICKQCGTEPWLKFDDNDYLIIRNFNKWNKLCESRGGKREGAGRPKLNQSDKSKESNIIQKESSPTRGKGIGSYSYSEEEDITMFREVPEDDAVSSSERMVMQGNGWASQAWVILPSKAQAAKRVFGDEFILAVRRGEDPLWLIERLKAYYNSPVGQGQYFKLAHKFLSEGMYDDSDKAWQQTRESKPEASQPFDYEADLDRRMAHQNEQDRKQREEDEQQEREYIARKEREAQELKRGDT